VTGVTEEAVPEPPVAYCENCDGETWDAPEGDRDPTGYCRRAAQQHTRDTGHSTVLAVAQLTRYKQGGTQ
jgi:hypothetical protein